MPAIYMEYSPSRIKNLGGDPDALLELLVECGYQLFLDDWVAPFSLLEVNRKTLAKGYVDILLLHTP
jgi:hypothetical protein